MKILALIAGLLLAGSALALPEHAPRPGGIAIIDIGPAGDVVPEVRFDDKPVLVAEEGGRLKAIIGVPLGMDTGELDVSVGDNTVSVTIFAHGYKEQRLTIKN